MDEVEQVVPVDVYVAGCPPRPDEIINAVVATLGILKEDVAHGGREWRKKKQVTPAEPAPVVEGGESAEVGT
jgi:Ni,Fe-hydrogenase III small subunit